MLLTHYVVIIVLTASSSKILRASIREKAQHRWYIRTSGNDETEWVAIVYLVISVYTYIYIHMYIYLLNMSLVIGVYAMFQLTCLCMFSSPRRKLFRTILECGLWHLHEPNRWALVFVVERKKTKQRKFVEPRGTRILKNLKACMLHDYDCCALGFCGVIFTLHRFISYCINSTWAQGCAESRHLRLW